MLLNKAQHAVVFQRKAIVHRPNGLLLVSGCCVAVVYFGGGDDAVHAAHRVGYGARLHADPKDVERGVKHVQQAGVVRVFDVFVVQLPVRLGILAGAPQIDDGLAHHTVYPSAHQLT